MIMENKLNVFFNLKISALICTIDHNKINLLAPELFFLNFSTFCILNLNYIGTKHVKIMKQTAF